MFEPHFCVHCDRPCLQLDLCKKCSQSLPWITHLPSLQHPNIEKIQSIFSHEDPISTWIHQFKYRKQLKFTTLFSQLMLAHLQLPPATEHIIAIPLHSTRLKNRGYNQSELLAQSINKQLGIKHLADMMTRQKATQSQINLNTLQRQKNIKNCFKINQALEETLKDQETHTLIIDDVLTTGATLYEAANTLKHHYPKMHLHAWTVARAT